MGLTVTAYAKHRGVSPKSVYAALNRGYFAREADGTIEPYTADRAWDQATGKYRHKQPQNAPGAPAGPTTSYRERTERARAVAAELDLKARLGEVVPVADVKAAWAATLRPLRDRVLGLAERAAARVPADEAERTRRAVDEVSRELLEDLAAELESGGLPHA